MNIRFIQRLRFLLGRAMRLQCPRCGRAPLFRGRFAMYSECLACDLRFEREQGYFVGAIYINYAVTVLIAIAGYFSLDYFTGLSLAAQLVLWGTFSVAFPILFFRYSRSLWLCCDYLFDPDTVRADRDRERQP